VTIHAIRACFPGFSRMGRFIPHDLAVWDGGAQPANKCLVAIGEN
jgi:hypothetical protein